MSPAKLANANAPARHRHRVAAPYHNLAYAKKDLGMRYAVYDPNDPRKGTRLPDPVLRQIILGEGNTITKALQAASPPSGSLVWDRQEQRVAYTVP